MKIQRWGALAVGLSLLSGAALAEGRTDGPEGSEVGHGGYSRPSNYGSFSAQLDWGAAILDNGATYGAPIQIGGTLSFWQDDWFLLDLSGEYLDRGKRFDLLVGPRFRTPFWPVAFSLGFKAGPTWLFDPAGNASAVVRFAVSPQIGADLMLYHGLIAGLTYALDIPISDTNLMAHRVFLNLGYRF
jgi:hypothetical protein